MLLKVSSANHGNKILKFDNVYYLITIIFKIPSKHENAYIYSFFYYIKTITCNWVKGNLKYIPKRKSIKRVFKNYELSHIIQICELKMSLATIGLEIAHM
jgi:hypothetical protein